MTVCLDASVLVRCLTKEHGNAETLSWLRSHLDERMVAPAFLPFEFGSALCRKLSAGEMTAAECAEAISLFGRLDIRYDLEVRLLNSAFTLAVALDQPTVYDTAYLAVAEKEKCELWTFDGRFVSVASKDHPCVRLVDLRLDEANP